MNIFIVTVFAIMSGVIILLVSQIAELYNRIEYLERKFINISSDITDIYLRMRDK